VNNKPKLAQLRHKPTTSEWKEKKGLGVKGKLENKPFKGNLALESPFEG
jgi:hypothetical protein